MPFFASLRRQPDLAGQVAAQRAGLHRLALLWCGDRALADDLTHDALAKALAHLGQLRDPQRLRPWLYGILVNCWRDHLRARRPTEDIDGLDDPSLEVHDTPERAVSQLQLAAQVRQAVRQLPGAQREVLAVVDLGECSYAEAAEVLGIPVGTVMSRLCRARAALRKLLAEPSVGMAPLQRVK